MFRFVSVGIAQMTLWRKRRDGRLRKPIKIGGVGKNITPLEHVEEAEHG